MTDHWLRLEVDQLRGQNAELRARLEAIQTEYATFALPGSEHVQLTPLERTIVKALHDRLGTVVRKDGLHSMIYGLRGAEEAGDPKIIDVKICHLRRKLQGTDYEISTQWGLGYALHARSPEELCA